MTITCPHCVGALPTDGKQPGGRLHCARCNGWVLLARWASGAWYGVSVSGPSIARKVYQDE